MIGPNSHGFIVGRRRETAVLIQNITTHRARKRWRFAGVAHHDLTNAFGPSEWTALDDTNTRLVCEEDCHLAEQRYKWATIEIKASGAPGMWSDDG